jgi:hypothetical protein
MLEAKKFSGYHKMNGTDLQRFQRNLSQELFICCRPFRAISLFDSLGELEYLQFTIDQRRSDTMTYQGDFTLPSELLNQIATNGFDQLLELIRIVINAAMQAERQQYLEAAPYQRTPERQDQANGYKPKTVKTRLGEITFDVPQVREGGFYPEALEKGLRSESALRITLSEMYIQGVSTRKVTAIPEQLCGTTVSATQVSKAMALLDETFQAWRQRPLCECPYLVLDARYEKVRQDGQISDDACGEQDHHCQRRD